MKRSMIKLTDFSMKNTAAMFIIVLMLIGGGVFATSTLKVENLPDFSLPYVMISTHFIAPPDEILEEITIPIEDSVFRLDGVKNISSTSSDNFSMVSIELEQDQDPKEVKKDVESLLNGVQLPENAISNVSTISVSSLPVYTLTIYSKQADSTDLNRLYHDVFLPNLNAIQGMDRVESIGELNEELLVKLDAEKLQSYHLSPTQVPQWIQSTVRTIPASSVGIDGDSRVVRVNGGVQNIHELNAVEFLTPEGESVQLGDIADVDITNNPDTVTRYNGQEAIGINMFKTEDTNTVTFAEDVEKLVNEWREEFPDVTFHPVVNNATDIKESINGMIQAGIFGVILATFMILIFLRNIRMTSVVLVSIPLSIITTLLCMAALDITINIMTLGGMVIAVGRVVDDSIVVIENIYRRLEKGHQRNESVILIATKEVTSAVTSSTIATVVVFLPMVFVTGIVGEVFRPFALTIVIALLASLVIALTIIPILAKLMVIKQNEHPARERSELPLMTMIYKRILTWALNHRLKTLFVAALLFVLSAAFITPELPVSFLPEAEKDKSMKIYVELPEGISLEEMDEKMKAIEHMMLDEKDEEDQPRYTYVNTFVGFHDEEVDRLPHKATIFAEYSEATHANTAIEETRESVANLLSEDARVQVILISNDEESATTASNLSYFVKGNDTIELHNAASMVEEKMDEFPELSQVRNHASDFKKEIEITVDINEAQEIGFDPAEIMYLVESWTAEADLGKLKFDGSDYRTKVFLDPKDRDSIDKIEKISFMSPDGTTVELGEIASINEVNAQQRIGRENQVEAILISARIDDEDKVGVSNEVVEQLDKLQFPAGVTGEEQGVSDEIESGFIQMFIAIASSISIVYFVMVLTFGNASTPFAILFSLPLAVIGSLLGLWIASESINITSLIGFLMLVGIVVSNAIVLVSLVHQLRQKEHTVKEALIEAGVIRFRPIIMTAAATVIALLPLAFGISDGTLISKGLAVVVIGGLTTSTLLTLLVVPCVYDLIASFKSTMSRLFQKKSQVTHDKTT